MSTQKETSEYKCHMCGKCCYMEIPLTLLDIHRIANHKNKKPAGIFTEVVGKNISEKSSLFTIRKKQNGACIFLADDDRCLIHEAKPIICRFYNCSIKERLEEMPWTATCKTQAQREKLWEQTVAAKITKTYIEKNGLDWNKKDYNKALRSIMDNIKLRETQKLKLGRSESGQPVGILYDCSQCKNKGACAHETIITLNDIRRICDQRAVSWKRFFDVYISPEISSVTGTLKLKRDQHCILYDPQKEGCTFEEIKPFHCRFTPCPNRTESAEMMNALFLGSGTLEEQYIHQVSLAITRAYVKRYKTDYNKHSVNQALKKIDQMINDSTKKETFFQKISKFRYVNDTLIIDEKVPDRD